MSAAVLLEDDDLLVVDKPAGLLSVPTPGARGRTLVDALTEAGRKAPLPVHRLDRRRDPRELLWRRGSRERRERYQHPKEERVGARCRHQAIPQFGEQDAQV